MPFDDDELMDIYRARPTEARGVGCIDADVLRRAVVREITEDERNSIVAHIRACPECSSAYRAAHAAHEWATREAGDPERATPRIVATADSASIRRGADRTRLLALAAMLLIATAIGLAIWRTAPLTGNRSDSERGGRSVTAAISPSNGAALQALPASLQWESVDGADEYRVEIYDSQLTRVWASEPVRSPSVELPADLAARLHGSTRVFWRVTVGSGFDLRSSDLFQFQIAGP